jgi:hypothetical protein
MIPKNTPSVSFGTYVKRGYGHYKMKHAPDTNPTEFDRLRTPCAFSEAELAPIFELNALFLDRLVEAAARACDSGRRAWMRALCPQLGQLTAAARTGIARCPICLIDAGFRDTARWDGTSAHMLNSGESEGVPEWMTPELAQTTITLAWTMARTNLETACIVFGMSSQCARTVSALKIHRIPALAARNAHWACPVWENDPLVWQYLLSLSEPANVSRLPPPRVRAMQRRLAEVVLATPASRPNRHSRP